MGAMLYERVPPELQNRVFGLVASVSYAGYPVGGVLGGWAVAALGLDPAILLGSAVYVAATMAPLLRHRAAATRAGVAAQSGQHEAGPARPTPRRP
jgi:predicted MFS family arabinose efflux permease